MASTHEHEYIRGDEELDAAENFERAINSFFIGLSKLTIDEEIQIAIEQGMSYEDDRCYSFKRTSKGETLQAVGEVLLGE